MRKLLISLLVSIALSNVNHFAFAEMYLHGGWVWNEKCPVTNAGCWEPPESCSSGIDLRPSNDNSMSGKGIFTCSENRVGYRELTEGQAFSILKRSLTDTSEPTGEIALKPIMPDKNGMLKLRLGDTTWEEQLDFNSVHGLKVKAVMAQDARDMKKDDAGRYVALIKQRHGFNPAPEIKELTPHTTISDDFNRADSSALGSDWTEAVAGLAISSNQVIADSVGVNAFARHNTVLSSADHEAQVDLVTTTGGGPNSSFCGPVVRYSTSAQTFYYIAAGSLGGTARMYIGKQVAGTNTFLANSNVTWSLPEPIKLDVSGSNLTAYQNGVSRVTATDSAVTGNLSAGIYGYEGTSQTIVFDNFSATDGLTASPRRISVIFS